MALVSAAIHRVAAIISASFQPEKCVDIQQD